MLQHRASILPTPVVLPLILGIDWQEMKEGLRYFVLPLLLGIDLERDRGGLGISNIFIFEAMDIL